MYYVEAIPERSLIKIAVKDNVTLDQLFKIADEILHIKETKIQGPHKAWIFIANEITLPNTKELQAIELTVTRAKLFGIDKTVIQLGPTNTVMMQIVAKLLADIYTRKEIPVKVVQTNQQAEEFLEDRWKS